MRRADVIGRAAKNLRQAKVRTILTSLAIGVGAFTIALAMAAGAGGRAYTEEIVNTSGDAYSLNIYAQQGYEEPDPTDTLPEYGVEPEVEEDSDTYVMTDKDIAKLEKLDGVESVQPSLYIESQYVTRGEGYTKRVAPLSVKSDRMEMKLAAGSLDDYMLEEGQVTVPETFLESLGFDDAESAIGKKIYLNVAKLDTLDQATPESRDFELTVAAVDREGDTTFYYDESIRISPEDSQEMYRYQYGNEAGSQYHGITVLAKPGADIEKLQQDINSAGYGSFGLQDMRESLLQVVSIAQWGLAGFGALAILASIFGIINTQYISVLERTQQIGLMKALGMRSRDISRLFRYEAAWIGLMGGLIGVVLAWLVTLANPLIASFLELEEGTRLLRSDWLANLVLVLTLMVVAVASGYFPSRKAAKLDPIEALRAE